MRQVFGCGKADHGVFGQRNVSGDHHIFYVSFPSAISHLLSISTLSPLKPRQAPRLYNIPITNYTCFFVFLLPLQYLPHLSIYGPFKKAAAGYRITILLNTRGQVILMGGFPLYVLTEHTAVCTSRGDLLKFSYQSILQWV